MQRPAITPRRNGLVVLLVLVALAPWALLGYDRGVRVTDTHGQTGLLYSIASDPTTGGGINAPLWQLLVRTDVPSVYYKSGTASTAWTLLGSSSAGSGDLQFVTTDSNFTGSGTPASPLALAIDVHIARNLLAANQVVAVGDVQGADLVATNSVHAFGAGEIDGNLQVGATFFVNALDGKITVGGVNGLPVNACLAGSAVTGTDTHGAATCGAFGSGSGTLTGSGSAGNVSVWTGARALGNASGSATLDAVLTLGDNLTSQLDFGGSAGAGFPVAYNDGGSLALTAVELNGGGTLARKLASSNGGNSFAIDANDDPSTPQFIPSQSYSGAGFGGANGNLDLYVGSGSPGASATQVFAAFGGPGSAELDFYANMVISPATNPTTVTFPNIINQNGIVLAGGGANGGRIRDTRGAATLSAGCGTGATRSTGLTAFTVTTNLTALGTCTATFLASLTSATPTCACHDRASTPITTPSVACNATSLTMGPTGLIGGHVYDCFVFDH